MRTLFLFLANIFIIGLFLYSKLLPYKDKLKDPYLRIFNFFNGVFTPVLDFLLRFIKPFQVGHGLAVDMTQLVLLLLFLLIVNSI